MARQKRRLQRVDALVDRLDEQELLRIVLDLSLPSIEGLDLRDDIDARGEALFDQVARQRRHVESRADGGQDDDRRQRRSASSIRRAASCATPRAAERYCDHSMIGSANTAHIVRVPALTAVGAMVVLRFCKSTVRTSWRLRPS